jgi:pyruvate formate lyase activating enzyme
MDIKIDEAQRLTLLQKKEKQHPYLRTIHLLLKWTIPYEFRTTIIHPYHTTERFASMLELIRGAKKYFLQTYRPQKTLDPTFDGYACTEQEMKVLHQQASAYVLNCAIR